MHPARRYATAAAVLALGAAPVAAFAAPAMAAPGATEPPPEPHLHVDVTDGLASGQTVIITGTGLDPEAGYYVATCVTGSGGPTGPECAGDRNAAGSQLWVSNGRGATTPLNPDGTFTADLDVLSSGTAMDGAPVECAVSGCSVTVFYDHANGFGTVAAQPISFSTGSTGSAEAADGSAADPSPDADAAAPAGASDSDEVSDAAIGWGIGIPIAVIVIGGGVVATRMRARKAQGHIPSQSRDTE